VRPPLICLTGIDGCGKSTQATKLVERLEETGLEVEKVWTGGRPYISRPLVRLVKRQFHAPVQRPDGRFESRTNGIGDAGEEFSAYLERSNAMFQRWWILRRGWTDVSLFEHAVEANLAVQPHLLSGKTVVCDRYLYKSVVNLAVLLDLPLIALPGLLGHPALRLVPRPTLYFLLDVPADVGYARKHDLPSREYVERRVPIYRALAAYARMPVVDATKSPDAIADDIWGIVSEILANRKQRTVQATGYRIPG
jgi:thymidylate kinase